MRLERLSLEQGTMDGPPTQSEHVEEAEKNRLTTKVFPEYLVYCRKCPTFHSKKNIVSKIEDTPTIS